MTNQAIFASASAASTPLTVDGQQIPFLFRKEIIHLPASLLIGKSVTYPIAKQGVEGPDANPPLSLLWDQCRRDGTFELLKARAGTINLEGTLGLYYEINKDNSGNFSYLVGVLMDADTTVPEGFTSLAIPESDVAVCWYKYHDGDDIWGVAHGTVVQYMAGQGYEGIPDTGWCSEFYPFGDGEYKAQTGWNVLGYMIAGRRK